MSPGVLPCWIAVMLCDAARRQTWSWAWAIAKRRKGSSTVLLAFSGTQSYPRSIQGARHWQCSGTRDGVILTTANIPPAPAVCQALHASFQSILQQTCQMGLLLTPCCYGDEWGREKLDYPASQSWQQIKTHTYAVWLHHAACLKGCNDLLYFSLIVTVV